MTRYEHEDGCIESRITHWTKIQRGFLENVDTRTWLGITYKSKCFTQLPTPSLNTKVFFTQYRIAKGPTSCRPSTSMDINRWSVHIDWMSQSVHQWYSLGRSEEMRHLPHHLRTAKWLGLQFRIQPQSSLALNYLDGSFVQVLKNHETIEIISKF